MFVCVCIILINRKKIVNRINEKLMRLLTFAEFTMIADNIKRDFNQAQINAIHLALIATVFDFHESDLIVGIKSSSNKVPKIKCNRAVEI